MGSTEASLKEMVPHGALVMGTPIVIGFIFGCKALAGVLIGAMVSSVCNAIAASNTGGAWDNAKKYVEQGKLPKSDGSRPRLRVKYGGGHRGWRDQAIEF